MGFLWFGVLQIAIYGHADDAAASVNAQILDRKSKLAARVGLAPTLCGLTNRRATLTPPGNGAAGRIPTCIVPFRRRMPHVFGHGSNLKLVGMAGFPPAASRSQAGRSED